MITLTVSETESPERLDQYLARHIDDLSRSRLQKLIEIGQVQVNDAPQPARYKVRAGDRITVVVPPPEPASPQPQAMHLDVLFEDEHVLVLNKPAGLVVHPGAGQPDGTLVNALLARPGSISVIGGVERPGIVHRLDKDTSGLMMVAKNDVAHAKLAADLSRRNVKRIYWALALRKFDKPSGVIDAAIGRHPTVRTRMAVRDEGHGRSASTSWRVLEAFGGLSLVECRLSTGRTHQIRVHLASISHPVLGDDLYGGALASVLQMIPPRDQAVKNAIRHVTRQMLHARELSFDHPATGEPMSFTGELPADFADVLNTLRRSAPSA